MRFVFSAEQTDLRAAVRKFLHTRSSEGDVRRVMQTREGVDPEVWRRLAEELGVCGLAVPEEHGGAGASLLEVGIVLEELGASLACSPYLASVWLAQSILLRDAGPEVRQRWLPELASGALRATVALSDPAEPGTGPVAIDIAQGWRLDGVADHVLDGMTTDLVLVYAATTGGPALYLIEAHAQGLDRRPLDTLDSTRKQAELRFDATPAALVLGPELAGASLEHARALAAVGIALEQVGAAQRTLDTAVAYAGVRHQFGRPIGSFQAIKHKLADVLVDVESARSVAYAALWAAAEDGPELYLLASLAKSFCTAAALRAAAENIQVHGGIGFTWEHSAHLYLRRAKSAQLLFGDPVHHRHRFGDLLGLWEPPVVQTAPVPR